MKYYYCLYNDGNDRILKVSDDVDCLSNESIYNGSFTLGKNESIVEHISRLVNKKQLFYNYLEIDTINEFVVFNRAGEKV